MAYTPTGTFIPCKTNGFIMEKYSKSYKFSIVKPTTYPGEDGVNGLIWVMDLEAAGKGTADEVQTAKWAAGTDYSDDKNPVDFPLTGNFYIVSNLYSFPDKNPKNQNSLDGSYDIKNRDGVKYIEFTTPKLFRVKTTKELNANSTVDDLINLALDYLRNDYINTIYGRFGDPVWQDAYKKKEEGKITEDKLTEVYNSLGNLPENKVSFKIDEAGVTPTGTTEQTPPSNSVTAVKVESPTAVAEVQFKFNVEKTDTFIVVGGTVSPPLEFTIVPNDGTEYVMDVFTDDDLGDEYKEDVFAGDEELKNTYDSYIIQLEAATGQTLTPEEKDDIAKEMVKYKPGKPSKTPPPEVIKAMKDYGITNPLEQAHFLAQCAHESGQFAWKREFASGKAYEGRSDLGNTSPGDGVKYKGRGYIQITGKANYKSYDEYLKSKGYNDNVVANPELLEGKFAADCSVWFWCVAGPKNNKNFPKKGKEGASVEVVTKISKWVNGGTNGLQDRIDKFGYYWSVLEKNGSAYS